jgi:regulator of replication initiation timing
MIAEKIVKAREEINRGNWRAIKETDDIALLVGVVIDYVGKIQTSSIFENNF